MVVYWHHPPHSKGTHDSDTDEIMSGIRKNILSILDRYEVDLALCGHSHVYERSKMMKGYYGSSKTFDASKYNVGNSSGLNNGSVNAAPYIKERGAGKGMVYVVSGSSAYVGKSSYGLNHPAMYYSNDSVAGAALLEVKENRLDFKWICTDCVIRDQFTMMKGVNKKTVVQVKKGETAELKASFISNKYRWNKNSSDQRSIW